MSSGLSVEQGECVTAHRLVGSRGGNCYNRQSLEAFAFYIRTFKLLCNRSPQDDVNMKILIQEVWTGTWDPTHPALSPPRFCCCREFEDHSEVVRYQWPLGLRQNATCHINADYSIRK